MKNQLKKVVALSLAFGVFTLAGAQVVVPLDDGFFVIPLKKRVQLPAGVVYYNDFSTQADGERLDQFVVYRDPWVVNNTIGRSDHAPTGGINCTAPEQTRPQVRQSPYAHVYQCLPGGNSELGHQMAFAMDTSGYGFVGALPDQVFTGLSEVSVDINTTSAGGRNFMEIKVVPADQVFVNGLPCIPDLPCNDGWDYNDIGAVAAGTDAQGGTGLKIATPVRADGYFFDTYNSFQLANGDTQYNLCSETAYCFRVETHKGNLGVRERFQHIFRDNGDGTVAFGVENSSGKFDWVEAPGAFPDGPVRVVIAFHNYTGTKSGQGPGFEDNVSPSEGGFTWHWDELQIKAGSTQASIDYFGGINAERIVTPPNCVAFTQGQRELVGNTDVLPRFHCEGDADLDL